MALSELVARHGDGLASLLANAKVAPLAPEQVSSLVARAGFWILLVLTALALARLTWLMLPAPQAPPSQAPNRGQVQERPAAAALDVSALVRSNLFGKAGAADRELKRRAEDTPETKLNLVLKGVASASDERLARAVIEKPGGKQRAYAVGAQLPGNARLAEIHEDHVILQRGTSYESLLLKRKMLEAGKTLRTSRTQAISQAPAQSDEVTQLLSAYRTRLATSPMALRGLVQLDPVQGQGGGIIGYRLSPGRDKTLLDRLGLQTGDVVTAVNGIGLTGELDPSALLDELLDAEQLELQVTRNGAPLALSFQVR